MEKNAKYHSNPQKENLLDVVNASETADPEEVLAITIEDLVETEDSMIGQEKCTKQHVLIVEKNAKYHSNPQKESLLGVKNAL